LGPKPDARETGIDIYEIDNFQKVMFIKGKGPYQTELKNGNLLACSETSFDIIKLGKTSYDILQIISIGDNVTNTIELSNGCLVNEHFHTIYFYKKIDEKYSKDHQLSIEGISFLLLKENQMN